MTKEKQGSQPFKRSDQSQIGCIGKHPLEDQTLAKVLHVLLEDCQDQTLTSYGTQLLLGNKPGRAQNQEAGPCQVTYMMLNTGFHQLLLFLPQTKTTIWPPKLHHQSLHHLVNNGKEKAKKIMESAKTIGGVPLYGKFP